MISFERKDVTDASLDNLRSFGRTNIFHTLPWIRFVQETAGAEPVVLEICQDDRKAGYFVGLIVRKFGFRILGSPFRGWDTYFMGLNLDTGLSLHDVLQSLSTYAFGPLRCHYLEIVDPRIAAEDLDQLHYRVDRLSWPALDLTPAEDELFAKMKGSCRTAIRKSIAAGIAIEQASDPAFAEEYYAQYSEVLENKSYVPTYDLNRLENMIRHMLPTGNLLLLRARNSEGICLATGIFLALDKIAVYWGGASWSEYRSLRPNEPLFWHAIRAMKARGVETLYLGETSEQFKEKFGTYYASICRLRKASNPLLDRLFDRAVALKSYRLRNAVSRILRR